MNFFLYTGHPLLLLLLLPLSSYSIFPSHSCLTQDGNCESYPQEGIEGIFWMLSGGPLLGASLSLMVNLWHWTGLYSIFFISAHSSHPNVLNIKLAWTKNWGNCDDDFFLWRQKEERGGVARWFEIKSFSWRRTKNDSSYLSLVLHQCLHRVLNVLWNLLWYFILLSSLS